MELRHLASLVEVADRGSFTAAAQHLHLAQSAVSQHVRQVEQHVGLDLLTRAGGVRPTTAGVLVLERARTILREVEALETAVAELKGLVTGSVRVGSLQWFGPFDLPGLLSDYVRRWPGVDVVLHEDSSIAMMTAIVRDQLDVAFVSLGDRRDVQAGLEFLPLAVEPLVIAAPDRLALSARGSAPLSALDGLPFVAFASGLGLRHLIDAALRAARCMPHTVMESNLPGMVRALVSSGAGLSIVPVSVVDAPGNPLRSWSISPRPLSRHLGLVWASSRALPPAAVALRDLAAKQSRTSPSSRPARTSRVP